MWRGSVGNCLADKLTKWAVCIWSTAGVCEGFLTHVTRGVHKCEQWRLVGSMHDCPWRANDADGGEWEPAHEEHAAWCHPSSLTLPQCIYTHTLTFSLFYSSASSACIHLSLFLLWSQDICKGKSETLCQAPPMSHGVWYLWYTFLITTFRILKAAIGSVLLWLSVVKYIPYKYIIWKMLFELRAKSKTQKLKI